jgi:polyphenol oxidase
LAEPLEVIRAAALGEVPHGFFGRRGGTSTGEVAELNTGWGAGDDPAVVRENRLQAAQAVLPGATLACPYQYHSADALIVDEVWPDDGERPRGDALATARLGILLGIVTADCAPVLFADVRAGVIGAAHAGWRGAHGGVCENTVAAMEALGAERANITAAIGPTIAQANYEVGEDFRTNFADSHARFFAPGREGHYLFDLPGYIAARLERAGIGFVEDLALDTYPDETRFYSYRRSTHRGEASYGRQIALIGLPG